MAVDVSLLRRSWYVDALRATHPARWAPLRAETDAFLEDLRAWERDPKRLRARRRPDGAHQRALPGDGGRARARPRRRAAAPTRPATSCSPPVARPAHWPIASPRTFPLTPRGLVFALRRRWTRSPRPSCDRAASSTGRSRSSAGDVARLKVRPVYLSMVVNRGRFLELARRPRRRPSRVPAGARLGPVVRARARRRSSHSAARKGPDYRGGACASLCA